MARRGYSNVATPLTIVGTLDGSSSSNTVTVSPTPAGWPAVPFYAVIDKDTASEELVLVTAVSGTAFTFTRGTSLTSGYGSTTKTHNSGATVKHVASAADYDEANAHINGSHAPASAIDGNILDAKGDLISATADNTAARVPVGADGTILTADSTAAQGVSWKTNTAAISVTDIETLTWMSVGA